MKKVFNRITLCALLLIAATTAHAQLVGWQYRMPVSASDTSGFTLTNYQVRLSINTAALIAAGHMQASGDDIRFGDSCGTTIYQHYVESGMNTSTTLIWVKVPTIPANGSTNFFMFYGNSSAVGTSSFGTVFPAAFISGGPNTTLTGTVNYDWFQVDVNDTVFVQAGSILTINARYAMINGVISGNGRGYQAPTTNTAGTGPGGGGTSTNSGCGGGSYAGVGGTGGMDAGDTPGTGGPAYGTATANDLDMGSSGGSGTGISSNGHGGGALILNADYISVNGTITMNGASPSSDGTGRGAGGGAGGGIMLTAGHVTLAGTLSAAGGNGAAGTSTANDSGGGGGGGRVKTFYSGTLTNTGITSVANGTGGPNGTAAPGQPGTAGSSSFQNAGGYDVPPVSMGSEVSLAAPTITLSATSICAGDVVTVTANTGYDSYQYLVNGNIAATDTNNTYSFSGLSNGDSISVAGIFGCFVLESQATAVTVNSAPVFTLGADSAQCGGSITLDPQYVGASYLWSDSSTASNLSVNTSGSYSVWVTDSAGCVGSDTVNIIINTPPTVIAGTLPTLCVVDGPYTLGGSPAGGIWSGTGVSGMTFDPVVAGQGVFVLTYVYTDSITGCMGMDTASVNVDLCLNVNNGNSLAFGISPNPNNGSFAIDFGTSQSNAVVELIDATGRAVQTTTVSGSRAIVNCESQPAGIYFVRVTADGVASMKKITIVK